MASVTLAQIRDVVRSRGDYPRSQRFNDPYVNGEIQKAFAEFWELLDDTNEGWWDVFGTITTVASQAYLALPADCWRVKGIDINLNGEWRELAQVGIGDRNKFASTPGRPSAYRTSARGVELYRTPDAAYSLRVVYAPSAPALEENTARDFVNAWDDYVIEAALIKLDEAESRPIGDRERALGRVLMRVKSGGTKRRQQEPEYLNLRSRFDVSDEEDFL